MDEKYIWWLHKKFYIMQKQLESQSESQVCSPLFSNTAWTPLGKLSCSRLKKDEFVPLLRWDSLTCMRTSLVDCILFCSLVSGPFTTSFLSSSCGVWHNSFSLFPFIKTCWQPPDHLHPLWSDFGKQKMEQLDAISQVSCTVTADLFPIAFDTFSAAFVSFWSSFFKPSKSFWHSMPTCGKFVSFWESPFLCKNTVNYKISVRRENI